jgi:hypothetical protein
VGGSPHPSSHQDHDEDRPHGSLHRGVSPVDGAIMLTLKNPEIVINISHPSHSFHFAREMMKRVANVVSDSGGWHSNGAEYKAMTFYAMAEFVRKCYNDGLTSVRIVQDDQAMDPCSWSSTRTSPYHWYICFDEGKGIITVSKNLMQHLIKN